MKILMVNKFLHPNGGSEKMCIRDSGRAECESAGGGK